MRVESTWLAFCACWPAQAHRQALGCGTMARLESAAVFAALMQLLLLSVGRAEVEIKPKLSEERVVFQLEKGDLEFAFYPEVAPITTAHIFKLVQLGLYTTNHFFRVDKGFVAQVADVSSGRQVHLNAAQKEHADKTVPLEVMPGVKHHAGRVSMARGPSKSSGSSSFFICLGDAPHLDGEYAVFGEVTKGMELLRELENVKIRQEGIFKIPLERITILNSYWYMSQDFNTHVNSLLAPAYADDKETLGVYDEGHLSEEQKAKVRKMAEWEAHLPPSWRGKTCEESLKDAQDRIQSLVMEVEDLRKKLLP